MLRRAVHILFGAGILSLMITIWIYNSRSVQEQAAHLRSIAISSQRNVVVPSKCSPAEPSYPLTQASRRRTLHRTCSRLGFYEDATYGNPIPHSSYSRNMYVSDKFQTVICLIPKAGSSSWVGTLLVLEGVLNTTSGMSTREIVKASKKGVKSLARFKDKVKVAVVRNFTTVLFVRNPYTRLLSAFKDRLETYPNRNIFHRRAHNKKIYTMFGNHSSNDRPGPSVKSDMYNVTFKAFVDYYLSGVTDVHWREQHKVCPPCLNYDYIGKVETFAEDYNDVLRLIGAESKVPLIKASHATHSSDDSVLKTYYDTLTDEQFQRLGKVLAPDMMLYGYAVPDAIKRN